MHDWKLGGEPSLRRLSATTSGSPRDPRFLEAVWPHALLHRRWRSSLPLVLGTAAALVFHREFPLRGLLRAIFIMPMMATPVAIALVWTMMFHPQLGVLNYLLSLRRHAAAALGLSTRDA